MEFPGGAVVAQVWSLALELLHAAGAAKKKKEWQRNLHRISITKNRVMKTENRKSPFGKSYTNCFRKRIMGEKNPKSKKHESLPISGQKYDK